MESKKNGSDKNVACMGRNIKLVENLIEEYKIFGDLDGIQDLKLYMESLEHLIEAYKELEEENETLKNLADNKQWIFPCYVAQNYIPVSLVEEKIEEIQKEYEETLKTADFKEIEKMNKINFRGITLEGQRKILQELLEKRK